MAQIIFLHGASSSGKSTLARALQARLEKPFWHISIDHLRDSGIVPMDRFRAGDFRWADARDAFFAGFHASLAAYADAGNDLILEHILEREGWLDMLVAQFARHDVLFVALHCPVDILEAREAARGDRPIGSARQDFKTIHVGKRYDIELNATEPPDVNVECILAAWRLERRCSSFQSSAKPAGPLP